MANAYQDQLDEAAKRRFIARRFQVRGLELPSCELVLDVDAEIRKNMRAPVDAVASNPSRLVGRRYRSQSAF